jgi:hypothetical protein
MIIAKSLPITFTIGYDLAIIIIILLISFGYLVFKKCIEKVYTNFARLNDNDILITIFDENKRL